MQLLSSENRVMLTDRFYQTLIQSERDLRAGLEERLRSYHRLMQDLVHMLETSEALDSARRVDPTAPRGWGPDEWRAFWERALQEKGKAESGWNKHVSVPSQNSQNLETDADALRSEVMRLRSQLAELRAALSESRTRAEEISQAKPPVPVSIQTSSSAPEASPSSLEQLIERLKRLDVPSRTRLPVRLREVLSTGQRFRREVQALWLLSQGLSVRLEMDLALAAVNGLKPRSGSIRRLFERLAENGLVEMETLRLSKPKTGLALVRLSEKGRTVVEALFGEPPAEGDWDRLRRLHEGERFPEHTVAVLIFALHARLRGWETEIMPDVDGMAAPDVAVRRADEHYYVEVERGEKRKDPKWRHIAEANGGVAALCAMTPEHRSLLVGDCKSLGLPGVATDLESLIKVPFHDAHGEPLWLEKWK